MEFGSLGITYIYKKNFPCCVSPPHTVPSILSREVGVAKSSELYLIPAVFYKRKYQQSPGANNLSLTLNPRIPPRRLS